jgi:hypothetical protein
MATCCSGYLALVRMSDAAVLSVSKPLSEDDELGAIYDRAMGE